MTIITTTNDQVASDAEIARALQEQFRQEEEAAAAAAAERSTREVAAIPRSERDDGVVAQRLVDAELRAAEAFETSVYSDSGGGRLFDDDAEVARRMEQETRDAAFAASLAQQDNVPYASARGAHQGIMEDPASGDVVRRRRRKRSMNTCLSIVLALAFVSLLYRFLRPTGGIPFVGGGGEDPFDDLGDWFGWEGDNDNEKGDDIPWSSSFAISTANGLELRILNNLDEKWQETFFTVMNEWDNGDPDTVSFRIERISDPSCTGVSGAMVVCNANYGATSWRGINEIATLNGYIISSVAKLNEYYLDGRSNALRQYVCCHEIGHGLGLAHTDEGVYNADLGECMDYTVNPEANMHPGRTNFEALDKMYGTVGGGGRHNVRGLGSSYLSDERKMDSVEYSSEDVEWRVMRRTAHSEHHEADLGDGLKVQRVLLLA